MNCGNCSFVKECSVKDVLIEVSRTDYQIALDDVYNYVISNLMDSKERKALIKYIEKLYKNGGAT